MANQQEEERGSANSELRFITLDLMKIAQRRKMAFEKVAQEFVSNVYSLEQMLSASCSAQQASRPRVSSKEKL
ncbi:hypothetical protein J4441_03580 [Candidatus Micrarchaeota archaeon]|nr:hypothetical protein [Candidatus Micrarchaeota archaeon]